MVYAVSFLWGYKHLYSLGKSIGGYEKNYSYYYVD